MQNRKQGQACVFSSESITFCRFSCKNLFHSRYIDPISCFHVREYCWKRLNFLLLLKVKATQKLTMCTALAGKVSECFAQGAWSSFKFCVLAKWKKSGHVFFWYACKLHMAVEGRALKVEPSVFVPWKLLSTTSGKKEEEQVWWNIKWYTLCYLCHWHCLHICRLQTVQ